MAERYYLTTAISYPNGRPHIGHAYELIATDAIARFKRLDGAEVLFLTGTDEHGIKMLQTARSLGIEPLEGGDHRRLVGDVEAGFMDRVPCRPHLADGGEQAVLVGAVENDGGAGCGQSFGHRAAQSARRAGDEGGTALE